MPAYPKRLIEADLPIRRIAVHSSPEKSIRHGHISTLHIWLARRPLAACRGASICAALWPEPIGVAEKDQETAGKVVCAPVRAEEHVCASVGGAICRFSARPESR